MLTKVGVIVRGTHADFNCPRCHLQYAWMLSRLRDSTQIEFEVRCPECSTVFGFRNPFRTAKLRESFRDDALSLARQVPDEALAQIETMRNKFDTELASTDQNDLVFLEGVTSAVQFVAYQQLAIKRFEQTKTLDSVLAALCEKAVIAYAAVCGTITDIKNCLPTADEAISLLEACHPGRAYEAIGKIKIKHLLRCERIAFAPMFLQAMEAGVFSRAEIDEIAEIELTTSSGTVRFASVGYLGPHKWLVSLYDDAAPFGSNRSVIHVGLLENVSGKWQYKENLTSAP